MADLLRKLDDTEINDIASTMESGVAAMGMKYADNGKVTFDDFLKAMQENEDMNKIFLKISDL